MVVFGLVGMQMSCEKIKAVRKVIKEIAGRNYLRVHNRRVSQKKTTREFQGDQGMYPCYGGDHH